MLDQRRTISRNKLFLLLALIAALPFCVPQLRLHAQAAGTASVQGSVVDSTGAVLPGATISLVDNSTHVTRTVTSDSSGSYTFPNVPVGNYTLNVIASGFRTYVQTNIVLEVGSSIAINVTMVVGTNDQRVEVKAEGLALQTEDSSFKQTIDQQTVTEMPLNGRQMTGLIALSGGST
ncbi:MAG TPA: carboxypeptidase-like regulatory domain-containing protein, partial [Edaphobacter sp.]